MESNPKLKIGFVYQPNSQFKTEINSETEINQTNFWIVLTIALLQVWLVYKTEKANESKK